MQEPARGLVRPSTSAPDPPSFLVLQGSLVGFDRLRFDFNLPRGMSGEEVRRVEQLVNGWIQEGRPLATSVMALQQAKDAGRAQGHWLQWHVMWVEQDCFGLVI